MKIWEKRADIDPGKSFKSFLYKVAENLVYAYFRKLAKDQRLLAKLTAAYVDADTSAADKLEAREHHDLLRQAIDSLSPQRKRIYVLCKLEGKSYEEASQELGLSTATIRNQIVKANKALRSYLYRNQELTVLVLTEELLRHLR
ncbi:MAG: sigma-70 family RNA polymerase sigma factor [Mucilaginibacter sp.]